MPDLESLLARLEALETYLAELDHYAQFSLEDMESDFAEQLAPIASFRNVLVHDYLLVDPEIVHDFLVNGRADLREFGSQITNYLQSLH